MMNDTPEPEIMQPRGMSPNERRAHLIAGPITPIGTLARLGIERTADAAVGAAAGARNWLASVTGTRTDREIK